MGQRNVTSTELQWLATSFPNMQPASASKTCVLECHLHSTKFDEERGLPLSKFLKGKAKQRLIGSVKGQICPRL